MKQIITLLLFLGIALQNYGQNVGIGTNSPNETSSLELANTNKGFLPNRVALISLDSISPITLADGTTTPLAAQMPDGLMVYNTATAGVFPSNVVPGYYAWNASTGKWKAMFTNQGLNDVGIVSAFPGATLPNDMYLALDGGTYNRADYPEFSDMITSLSLEVVTSTATTFTLANWNSDGIFLRGQGTNAAALGTLQNDATAQPNTNFTTSSSTTSSDGAHNHNFYTANHDVNSSSSQGYPAGNNHNALRTTDRRQRTEDNGTIRTEGAHTHTIPSLQVSGGGDVETRPINRSINWVIKVKPSAAFVGALTINNNPSPADADWYIENSTSASTDINDNIYTNGNVGVGVAQPQQELDVDGTIRSSDLAGTGTRTVVADANGDLATKPSAKVINTWFATTTSSQAINSNTPVLINGLSITLTPSSTDSKFIIMAVVNGSMTYVSSTLIYRNGVKLLTHGNNNNESGAQATTYTNNGLATNLMEQHIINYQDAPNTTASVTYDIRFSSAWTGTSYTSYINDRATNDMRTPSTLLIMEVEN